MALKHFYLQIYSKICFPLCVKVSWTLWTREKFDNILCRKGGRGGGSQLDAAQVCLTGSLTIDARHSVLIEIPLFTAKTLSQVEGATPARRNDPAQVKGQRRVLEQILCQQAGRNSLCDNCQRVHGTQQRSLRLQTPQRSPPPPPLHPSSPRGAAGGGTRRPTRRLEDRMEMSSLVSPPLLLPCQHNWVRL